MSNKQPLNVKDALSYLDQVKVQFAEKTDVYNQFLDIMKDFKSQAIDTPGVIDRVSNLFKGHPTLIQGFNTFLPSGYHIECSTNPLEPDLITITTPTGITTTKGLLEPHHSQQNLTSLSANLSTASYYNPSFQHPPPQPPPTSSLISSLTPHSQVPQPQPSSSSQQPTLAPYHISTAGQQNLVQAVGVASSQNIRFGNEPDTYKQFLEILQTYQKEQKPIQEVYAQVQVLFNNAPDLLDEFKQFLPDISGNTPQGGLFSQISQGYGLSAATRLPPVGSFPSSPSGLAINADSFRKSSIPGGGGPSTNSNSLSANAVPGTDRNLGGLSGKTKKSKISHKLLDQSHVGTSLSNVKTEPHHHHYSYGQPNYSKSSERNRSPPANASEEELAFFEKVKRIINSKPVYCEFLKLINLYSQQILDSQALVKRVSAFIGHNAELFEWFKQYIKYEEKDEIVQNTASSRPRVDLEGCISHGPSYRQLPSSEANSHCSGRDEMCYEVLNDEWVSHPTWASEDAGFVSHKKNQYEEALHKCEEERYEYDMFVEANQHTIALLSPIDRQISRMSAEEKSKFKLEPGLGGKSRIYQKVIKKVYDHDKGLDVIDALHNNPGAAVPVVLKRLKQKDEEWKRARREWNKIWREIEAKNFYKSLDHQGITFKNDDKKVLTPKYLISEIENICREKAHHDGDTLEYQFKFSFKDLDVFKDIYRIIFFYIDRSGTFALSDRDKIEKFLNTFPPKEDYTNVNINVNENINYNDNDEDKEDDDNYDNSSSMDIDITKGPLATEPINCSWIQVSEEVKDNIRQVVTNAGNTRYKKKTTCYFFGNTAFYCFFRFLQMLFERLEKMKAVAQNELSSASHTRKLNPAATELADVDLDLNKGDPYTVMLELIEKQFDGEMDLATFEECLRYIYGTKAYIMFTVDKLIQNITKQIQVIVSDSKSASLIELFEENKKLLDPTSGRSHIMYQLHANNTIGYEEHTYRIDYVDTEEKNMTILLSGSDYTIGSTVSSEERWAYYMYSFMSLNPTEGLNSRKKKPFLKRNLPSFRRTEDLVTTAEVHNGLEVKICLNSYHIFFVSNTEDNFRRYQSGVSKEKMEQDTSRRLELWQNWLKAQEKCLSLNENN
nr:9542_t:CDS:10 [Entrophospora candida]